MLCGCAAPFNCKYMTVGCHCSILCYISLYIYLYNNKTSSTLWKPIKKNVLKCTLCPAIFSKKCFVFFLVHCGVGSRIPVFAS